MSLTDEQKKKRLEGCGGSEVGALVGLNPYMTPIDVYANKCEGREITDSHHLERGRFFERPTAEWWAHRNSAALREVGTIQDTKHPLVICTPDFLAKPDGQDELDLSIKVPGPHTAGQWGEAGTDDVPDAYLVQVQWELIPLKRMFGITKAVIAAPIAGDLREYPIEIDEDIQAHLIEAVERFWRDHVIPRRPPPPDASASYEKWLKKRFPASKGELLPATPEAERLARMLRAARKTKKEAEEKERAARNELITLIGDNEGILSADWKITHKTTKGRETVDWKALCFEAGVSPSLVEKFTSRTPYRVFRPTFKGEENEDE